MRRRLLPGSAAVLGLLLASCSTTPPTTAPPAPAPQPATCTFGLPVSETRSCGTIQVPVNSAYPQGAQQRLAYAVLPGSSPQKSRVATVVLQGGPGGRVWGQATRLNSLFKTASRPLHDVIFYDVRGVGESGPESGCSLMPVLAATAPQEFTKQAQDCLTRLQATGLNPADLNTRTNVEDLAQLIGTLGYEQVNLYGMSYGTRTAQEFVKRHPELVRAMVLDGVIDPTRNTFLEQPRFFQDLLTRYGQECQAAGACTAADLPGEVQRAADLLDSLKLTFPFQGSQNLPLNGDVLMAGISGMAYSPARVMALPRLLANVQDREVSSINFLAGQAMQEGGDLNRAVYAAVGCQDMVVSQADQESALSGLLPAFQRRAQTAIASLNVCAQWGLSAPPDAMAPIGGKVPTLLLSGRYDAVTPPLLAESVKSRFTPSQHVIFEYGGHVNGMNDLCGIQMLLSFLNDPAQPLNTACAAQPFKFK